jgi:hypothetical protein
LTAPRGGRRAFCLSGPCSRVHASSSPEITALGLLCKSLQEQLLQSNPRAVISGHARGGSQMGFVGAAHGSHSLRAPGQPCPALHTLQGAGSSKWQRADQSPDASAGPTPRRSVRRRLGSVPLCCADCLRTRAAPHGPAPAIPALRTASWDTLSARAAACPASPAAPCSLSCRMTRRRASCPPAAKGTGPMPPPPSPPLPAKGCVPTPQQEEDGCLPTLLWAGRPIMHRWSAPNRQKTGEHVNQLRAALQGSAPKPGGSGRRVGRTGLGQPAGRGLLRLRRCLCCSRLLDGRGSQGSALPLALKAACELFEIGGSGPGLDAGKVTEGWCRDFQSPCGACSPS